MTPPFLIRQLRLPEELKEFYRTGTFLNRLVGLSTLNVFVGPNNSGKSRLLRTLFKAPPAYSVPSDENDALSDLTDRYGKAARQGGFNELAGILERSIPKIATLQGQRKQLGIPEPHQLQATLQHSSDFDQLQAEANSTARKTAGSISNLFHRSWAAELPQQQFKRVYVPTLRGLRTPKGDQQAFFRDRTVSDYFEGKTDHRSASLVELSVFTGAELFDQVRSHLLGTLQQRALMRAFERFLGDTFFKGDAVTLIPREGDDVLHVKIGVEAERPIYHLGDGIQHLIVLTLPVYIHRGANLLLFIEEPELFLHPGFQRVLIDTFLNAPVAGGTRQVFVTTHSNQFLDITIDRSRCSVYRVQKSLAPRTDDDHEQQATYDIGNSSNDHFQLLRELGVRNSSVLLSNCTVWVEGVTDRLYLRRYFEIFQRELPPDRERFLEDLHFSFVEYGGGNITHWSFLDEEGWIDVDRLCGRLLLVTDNDCPKKGSAKDSRLSELTKRLGERHLCLECREIENLLTPEVIQKVVRSYEGPAVVLNPFTRDQYADKPLGRFIESKVLPKDAKSKRPSRIEGPYAAASGTVKDKLGFCNRAIEHINGIEDLSDEARCVCERIYDFIHEHNQ